MKPTKRTPTKSVTPTKTRRAQIRLEERGVKAVRAGHPWVFRNALLNEELNMKSGEIVPIFDPDAHFLAYGLYEKHGAIALRIMSKNRDIQLGDPWLRGLASRALEKRAFLKAEDITTYRIVNGEADSLPGLTVTRYDQWLLAIQYVEGMDRITEVVVNQLLKETGLKGAYKQSRLRPSGAKDLKIPPSRKLAGEEAPLEVEVVEDGLRYLVDITAPMGVGFFPDYREGHRLIKRLAPGRRMLNLFSYTGAFGICALGGGATEAVNVDSAQRANTKAEQNAKLNGFGPEQFSTVTGDVFRTLNEMIVRGERFDLAVVDPPSFSKGKGGTWSSAKDYTNLIRLLLQLMEPGAYILFTTNMAKMPMDSFERSIALGAGLRPISILHRLATPFDYPELPGFPEGSYLKSLLTLVD